MEILLHVADDNPEAWVADLQHALPDHRIRIWQSGDFAHADYALVWRPTPEIFRARTSLRAIFNLGAGVDATLELERKRPGTLPPGVPIARLEDSGMAAQMAEYAMYAILRHLRRLREYEVLQARTEWRPLEAYARREFPVAVLGLGQLGSHVARTLADFGLPVRGFSRKPKLIEGVTSYEGDAGLTLCLAGAPRSKPSTQHDSNTSCSECKELLIPGRWRDPCQIGKGRTPGRSRSDRRARCRQAGRCDARCVQR